MFFLKDYRVVKHYIKCLIRYISQVPLTYAPDPVEKKLDKLPTVGLFCISNKTKGLIL